MKYMLTVDELLHMLETGKQVAIIDVRANLQDKAKGRLLYEEHHIPNAAFFDLESDLSGDVQKHGGSHPLPEVDVFVKKLEKAGVSNDVPVLIYDDGAGMFAARCFWMIDALGHRSVYILEGGYKAWLESGYPVSSEEPEIEGGTFKAHDHFTGTVTMEEVKNHHPKDTVVIDSRSYERYLGQEEPLYKKAGHIPGAHNYFWADVMEGGKFKGEASLKEHFAPLSDKKEIVVSCGSGVSACPNIMALKSLGFNNVKLYPGSFSDWISYDDNELETKDETER